MSPVSDQRWSHITYASFKSETRRSGWNVGPSINAGEEDKQEVSESAPTSLVPVKAFDDFISSSDIDALPRRFEFKPLLGASLYMQSVPAGKDSTGRPGNVFTHAVVDHNPDEPLRAQYPIELYRSPDLLTPFRANAVNAVELKPGLAEPARGPMADLTLAWMMVDDMFGDRREALYQLQDVLQAKTKTAVLLLKNSNEAAYWVQALSSTLTPEEARLLLHFSTFDRAATFPTRDPKARYSTVVVCPPEDAQALRDMTEIQVIDPDNTSRAKHSEWAQLTAALFAGGTDFDELIDEISQVNNGINDSALRNAQLGHGLARVIKNRADAVSAELYDLAEGFLPADEDFEVVARYSVLDDLSMVENVVRNPRLALDDKSWPLIDPSTHGAIELDELSYAGIRTIKTLHDAPIREVMAYVDFLLHTGLLREDDLENISFLDQFAQFRGLSSWERATPLTRQHPLLRGMLKAAVRQQGFVEKRQNRGAEQPELSLLQSRVGTHIPLKNVCRWLEQQENVATLERIADDELFKASARSYALTMLRLYYSVALRANLAPIVTGDRSKDRRIVSVLARLCDQAVSRHVALAADQAQLQDSEPFVELGRTLGATEITAIAMERDQPRYLGEIKKNTDPKHLELGQKVNDVFVIVARAIIAERDRLKSLSAMQVEYDRKYRKQAR